MEVVNNESHQKEAMLKLVLFFLLIIQTLTVSKLFSQTITTNRTQSPIKYALFTSRSDVDFAFYRQNYKPIKLTKNQLNLVQSIIKKVSDSLDFFVTSTNVNTGIVDTLKHSFQIVSAINKRGQVYVWVNAICNPNKDWRSRLIFADDGGSCYYRFRINLMTKQYFDIEANSSG